MAFDALRAEAPEAQKEEELFKSLQDTEVVPGLKVGLWGPPETGKTYFIGTCPPPVKVIDTEFGTRQVFKYHFPDREIDIAEVRIVQKDPTKVDYEATFNKIERAVYSLKDMTEGTIAIDSMSDVYTWMNAWVEDTAPRQVSKTGKAYMMQTEWGKRNIRYRNLVYSLISMPVNIVFTAQPKKEYGGRGTAEEGKHVGYVSRWLEQHDHWVDVLLKMEKWNVKNQIKYYATVDKCRMHRASNLRIEDVTYPKLLLKLREKFKLEIAGVNYDELKKA